MKNKQKPIDTMRLIRRIYRLSIVLVCTPLTVLAIMMIAHYVNDGIGLFYFCMVIGTPAIRSISHDIRIMVGKFAKAIWELTDDESI